MAILHAANVKFAVLGEMESCTGDSARRAGNEYLFYEMALANIQMLNDVKPPRILVTCPHCFHTIANEYPQFGGTFEVIHHTQFIDELVRSGRLHLTSTTTSNVTFHDPCYLGRQNKIFDAPRYALGAAGAAITEMAATREQSFCCGAGGAQFWKEEEEGHTRVSMHRYSDALATGADELAVSCPFCLRMFEDASQDVPDHQLPVKDIAEIVAAKLSHDT